MFILGSLEGAYILFVLIELFY